MQLIITPKEGILAELTMMDNFLNTVMGDDAVEAQERGNDLSSYISRSGKLLADAKYHLNTKKKDDIFKTLEEAGKQAGATATAINELIKSICKEEQYLVDWAGRVNATATHQLEWCRTVISKAKAEINAASMQRG